MSTPTDTEILDWLQEQAVKSRTGISIDSHVPETGPRVFRFMRFHHLGSFERDLRKAIAVEMGRAEPQPQHKFY